MEEQIQQLKDLVAHLSAENERLRQEPDVALPGPSDAPMRSAVPPVTPADVPIVERLVYVPRDRKCPMFRGRTGIGLAEWLEEAQACMRMRHLNASDQAFFLFDHLEGEAREEIKFRPCCERENPDRVIAVLQELYGCNDSYVALQEAFFSRRQQEGETLQEFSLALMSLMASVKVRAPQGIPNSEELLRDQFVEQVLDGSLRRTLKQFTRRQPTATLLEVRGEAIRWEREGLPGGTKNHSHSVPSVLGFQYGVSSAPVMPNQPQESALGEIVEMLRLQQQQINQLTENLSLLQSTENHTRRVARGQVICRRCQQPGHYAQDCDGVRVVKPAPKADRASQPRQLAENWHPPSC